MRENGRYSPEPRRIVPQPAPQYLSQQYRSGVEGRELPRTSESELTGSSVFQSLETQAQHDARIREATIRDATIRQKRKESQARTTENLREASWLKNAAERNRDRSDSFSRLSAGILGATIASGALTAKVIRDDARKNNHQALSNIPQIGNEPLAINNSELETQQNLDQKKSPVQNTSSPAVTNAVGLSLDKSPSTPEKDLAKTSHAERIKQQGTPRNDLAKSPLDYSYIARNGDKTTIMRP